MASHDAWLSEKALAIKPVIAGRMQDPMSVIYRNVLETDTGVFCGEVNARNSFGGYSDWQPFLAVGHSVYLSQDTGRLGEWIQTTCLGLSPKPAPGF